MSVPQRVGDTILRMRSRLAKHTPSLDYYSRLAARFNFRYDTETEGVVALHGKTMVFNPAMIEAMELTDDDLLTMIVAKCCAICAGHTTTKDLHHPGLDQNLMSWAMDFTSSRYAYRAAPSLYETMGTVTVEELADLLRQGEGCDKLALDMSLTDRDDVFTVYKRLKQADDESKPPPPEENDDEDEETDGGGGGEGEGQGDEPSGDDPDGPDSDDSGDGSGDDEPDDQAGGSGGAGDADGDGDGESDTSETPRPPMGNTTLDSEDGEQSQDDRLRSAAAEAAGANPDAFEQAELSGAVPGDALRRADTTGKALADWNTLLAETMTPDDSGEMQSYSPLDRLTYTIAGGGNPRVLYPSSYSEGADTHVWFVDVSGSVDDAALNVIGGELKAGMEAGNADTVYVVYVDATVRGVQVFSREDEIELTPTGGGGTKFEPAFEWLDDQDFEPDHVIYITDGMALNEAAFRANRIAIDWPNERDVKLTWLFVNCPMPDLEAPWGSSIHVSHASLYREAAA